MTGVSHAEHAVARIEAAIDRIRRGKMVILVDDEDRENEGDLCIAAEKVTPEAINFMAKHGRGLICLALTEEKTEQLQLALQAPTNTSLFGTAFTVTIDGKEGVTTGVSASDRATTVLTAIRDDVKVLSARIEHFKLEPAGVTRWGENSEANYAAYADFLFKWKVIKDKVEARDLVTNELIDEINKFDASAVAAEARGYKAR